MGFRGLTFLLLPFSGFFLLVVSLRSWLYRNGLLRTHRVKTPVVCVGNLTTGGTGKTPWVEWLCRKLGGDSGRRVTILSRGYSGDFDGELQVDTHMDPRTCGDEPLWLHRQTGRPVFVGRNRVRLAKMAEQLTQPDCLVLDDGFQHFALARDFNLILIDVSAPREHYRLLPMGRMREPWRALKRADALIFNKCNYAEKEALVWLQRQVTPFIKKDKIFYADFVFSHWLPLVKDLSLPLADGPVAICCGIGNPEAFRKTVRDLGFAPVSEHIFPDHYYWLPRDVEQITYQMRRKQIRHLLVTDKDAIKITRYEKHFRELGLQIWSCQMQVQLQEREHELLQSLATVFAGYRNAT